MKFNTVWVGMLILSCVVIATANASVPTHGGLTIEAVCAETAMLQGCPLVINVTVKNETDSDAVTTTDLTRESELKRMVRVVLEDGNGKVFRLFFQSGPNVNRVMLPGRGFTFPRGGVAHAEKALATVWWGPRGRGTEYKFQFVPKGEYSAHVVVAIGLGKSVSSNTFIVTIKEPLGANADARKLLRVEDADFLSGGERLGGPLGANGRVSGADARLPQNLSQLVAQFPDSPYAEWIRFWKVYHHGSLDEGLEYARTHKDFLLSDNLLLRKLEGLIAHTSKRDVATFRRARNLTDELLLTFPDGDTHLRALKLKKKISRKLGADSE